MQCPRYSGDMSSLHHIEIVEIFTVRSAAQPSPRWKGTYHIRAASGRAKSQLARTAGV